MLIAISAGDPDFHPPQAQEARFDHYLVKPVDLDVLCQLLSKHGP
jgi:hypothetical protein